MWRHGHAIRRRWIFHDAMNRVMLLLAIGWLAGCSQPQSCIDVYANVAMPAIGLAYPIPGATNVPDDIGAIVYFGFPEALELQSSSQTIATGMIAAPTPLPSPIASLPPYGGSYLARSVTGLMPETIYRVGYQYDTTSGCPTMATSNFIVIGSFTTE